MEELKEVVFYMKHNQAIGPAGLTIKQSFISFFCKEMKDSMKEMLDAFHRGEVDIKRLDHGIISLIPEVQDTMVI
jgi:hypothetical protein